VITRIPIAERLWSKVNKTETCWLWTASVSNAGYGQLGDPIRRSMISAHRVAWEVTHGPIPIGQCVLHKCDVKVCVNPDHLFLGTKAENTRDCISKGRFKPNKGGEFNRNSKLTNEQVREIKRHPRKRGFRQGLADKFGVSIACINGIRVGANWKHIE
jgi:hypothetical protein